MNRLLVASFIVAFAADVITPILIARWIWRRWKPPAQIWLWGAAVFMGSQVLTRIPIVTYIQAQSGLQEALDRSFTLYLAFTLALSLSAGLFEEGGRWIGYRYLVREHTTPNALLYGAGHGGLESIGIGALIASTLASYLVLTGPALPGMNVLTPEQLKLLDGARAQFTALAGWEPLLGGVERVATQPVHLALSLLVLRAFTRSARWWWVALGAHTWLDFSTLLLTRFATHRWGQSRGPLLVESLVVIYGLAALWVIRRLMRSSPPPAPHPPGASVPC